MDNHQNIKQAEEGLRIARQKLDQAVQAAMRTNDKKHANDGLMDTRFRATQVKEKSERKREETADARVAILGAIEQYRLDNNVGIRAAVEAVSKDYPSRSVPSLQEWIYDTISKVGTASLWGWRKTFDLHGRNGLIPQWKGRVSSCETASPELSYLIERILSGDGQITGRELQKRLTMEASETGLSIPSVRTCNRIIQRRRLQDVPN